MPTSPYMSRTGSTWDSHTEFPFDAFLTPGDYNEQMFHCTPDMSNSRQSIYSTPSSPWTFVPGSEPQPSRQSSTSSITSAESSKSTASRRERRKEQNRSSQRAYRHRKEHHLHCLEQKLAEWQARQEQLSASYSDQTERIRRLQAQINQLVALKTSLIIDNSNDFWSDPAAWDMMLSPPAAEFDAFSVPQFSSPQPWPVHTGQGRRNSGGPGRR